MTDEKYALEIDVQAVKSLMDGAEPMLLIDCREQVEYDHCRIERAVLLPMNETLGRVSELEAHRDSRIVVHCHHGSRSMQVVNWLRSQGFAGAQNMAGGIDAWSLQVDPEVPRY